MKKVIMMTLFLGACAPSLPGGGKSEYAYVGCHKVTENPSKEGDVAFGPFGTATSHIVFKQVSDDGTVGPVTTGVPCTK